MRQLMERFWKDRKGMTLIELMMGFAIFSIVLTVSLSIMLFGSRILGIDGSRDRMKMVGDRAYQFVSEKLTFATHLQLEKEGTDPDKMSYENVIYVSNGRLYYGPRGGPYQQFTEESLYQDSTLVMHLSVLPSSILSLDFAFLTDPNDDATAVYQTESAARILSMATGNDAQIEGVGEYKNPVISYDTSKYIVDEGYEPVDPDPENKDIPYTVFHYPDDAEVVDLQNNHQYAKGQVVYDKWTGIYWQAITDVFYRFDTPDSLPGAKLYDNMKWKRLDEEWSNTEFDTAYEYHDVVQFQGHYYMSNLKGANFWAVRDGDAPSSLWPEVYWRPDNEYTDENRMLGWSATPDPEPFVSIFEAYP